MPENLLTKIIISAITAKGNMDVNTLNDNCANANHLNKALLMKLLRDNQDTEYGRKYRFSDIHSVGIINERCRFQATMTTHPT